MAEKIIFDRDWLSKFVLLTEKQKYDFFHDDYPLDLKKLTLDWSIWWNKISLETVMSLIPDVIQHDFNFWDFHYVYYGKIEFDFNLSGYYLTINEKILEYLFSIKPLDDDKRSQNLLDNLALKKISLKSFTHIMKTHTITLTLDTWLKYIKGYDVWNRSSLTNLIDFIKVFLESGPWKEDDIHKVIENIFDVSIDPHIESINIWREIIGLFIEHGYDPSRHQIQDVYLLLRDNHLLDFLIEIMDPNILAKNIIISRFNRLHCNYFRIVNNLKKLAINGADINNLLIDF